MKLINKVLFVFLLFMLIGCTNKTKEFEVTFITNSSSDLEPIKVKENDYLDEPSITYENHILKGWFLDSNFNEKFDFSKDKVTSNITLYAKWEKKISSQKFEVSFVTGYDYSIPSILVDEDSLIEQPDIQRPGYTLINWTTDSDFVNAFDFNNRKINDDIILYANWKQNTTISNHLEGQLYGDPKFITKMRESDKPIVLSDDTIYVSLNGSDSASGTIDSPLKTINKAIEKAHSNISKGLDGIVCVREGSYAQNVSFNNYSGTEDNYLILTSYPNETVKIVGTEEKENVDFTMSNYIVMNGFTICDNIKDDEPVAVRMDKANHHIIFMNNTITNVKVNIKDDSEEPCGFLIYMNGTLTTASHNNILFYKNNLYDNQTGWSEAIEVVGNCENINIIENTVKDCGNIGIDVGGNFGYCDDKALDQARFVIIRGNDVSECLSYYATSYAIYVDGARDVIIEDNKAYDSQGGIEIGSEVKVVGYEVKNITVRNNLVYNNIENGITVGGYNNKVGVVVNTKIYNNTVVNNAKGTSSNPNEFDWNGQITVSMVDGLEVYNNIFYTSNKDHCLIGGYLDKTYCKNVVFRDNIYYANVSAEESYYNIFSNDYEGFSKFVAATNETGKYIDPLFNDLSNLDFTLKSESPAKNYGYLEK